MKKIALILFSLLVLLPIAVSAKDKYEDKLYDKLNLNEVDKIRIYFFHSKLCIHCMHEEEWLDEIKSEYGNKLEIVKYQIYKNEKNNKLMEDVKEMMGEKSTGFPYTVIGDKTYLGFGDLSKQEMEKTIKEYLGDVTGKTILNLPFGIKLELDSLSIPVMAIILGTLDGFNPCAMWILLFLINMLFNMKDKKRMWLLGFTFLITSALVYFLAMLGLTVVLGYATTLIVQQIIGIVAITGGLLNLNTFFKTPNDGCHVVDKPKREKMIKRIKKFTQEKSLLLSLIGVTTLAASVNLVELACSAGFPTIFVELMTINGVSNISKILYLLIYILFFLLDDIIVFTVAMKTLEVSGITTKYNKLSHLIGGLIMVIIGTLLILKPELIMFNF